MTQPPEALCLTSQSPVSRISRFSLNPIPKHVYVYFFTGRGNHFIISDVVTSLNKSWNNFVTQPTEPLCLTLVVLTHEFGHKVFESYGGMNKPQVS